MPRHGRFCRLSAFLSSLFFLGVGAAASLHAQPAGPLAAAPPISGAFPLVQRGAEVHVRYPLAINEHAVVPPGARLHFFYLRAQRVRRPGGEGAALRRHPRGVLPLGGVGMGGLGWGGIRMGTTDAVRETSNPKGGQADKPRRDQLDRAAAWTSCAEFRKALAGLNGSDLRLVFSLPAPTVQDPEPADEEDDLFREERHPSPRRVRDEPVVLPLGLLLAQHKGAPTVLAVEEGSAGEQAGLRAGDRIVSLNGTCCPRRLPAFLALYRREKERRLQELSVAVERAGSPSPLSLTVRLPPRMEGSILDTPGD
ncbi:MAG: PDZ domain-containing protein [Candidatus Methylacidiphilaceae bacterium]